MLVLKICCSEWKNENRDKRELSVCQELGMKTIVLAKGEQCDKGKLDFVDGFEVRRYSTRPCGEKIPKQINRLISLFFWAKYARSFNADIISGHDVSGILIAWLSNLFKTRKAKLVYDSHEFELGRNVNRNLIQKQFIKIVEGFLIKRSSAVIMVNASIALEVKKIYKLKATPTIVRNIPNRWNINEEECQKIRNEILRDIKGVRYILTYHGAISPNRGIESIICALKDLPDFGLLIIGNANDSIYFNSLFALSNQYGVRHRVLFKDAMPINVLWKYLGAADLGCCNISFAVKSYYYCLPNKLFENIQAGVPVLVSNGPELKRIVNDYGLGCVCEDETIDCFISTVRQFFADSDRLDICLSNIQKAKELLCWENEKQILIDLYNNLM